jgi:phosphopantothenoylcysteine decarboxylase/phosphopantothenate--cysteine ligase
LVKVGFAAETERVIEEGNRKLRDKGLDLLVANDVAQGRVFGSDTNHVYLIDRSGSHQEIGPAPKREVAERLLDALQPLLKEQVVAS